MATQEMLVKTGTQLLFADHATDFDNPATDPLAANDIIIASPSPVEVQMNLSVIAAAGAWQSAKTASLARTGSAFVEEWDLGACMESTATPAAGGTFDFYWNPTPNSTAGNGNSGGASGTDLAYAIAGLPQLIRIGTMTVLNNVINIQDNIGVLRMPKLYGSMVMVNNTSVAMVADGDADNCYITLTQRIPDSQAAA
jgi:hypothetical protein